MRASSAAPAIAADLVTSRRARARPTRRPASSAAPAIAADLVTSRRAQARPRVCRRPGDHRARVRPRACRRARPRRRSPPACSWLTRAPAAYQLATRSPRSRLRRRLKGFRRTRARRAMRAARATATDPRATSARRHPHDRVRPARSDAPSTTSSRPQVQRHLQSGRRGVRSVLPSRATTISLPKTRPTIAAPLATLPPMPRPSRAAM